MSVKASTPDHADEMEVELRTGDSEEEEKSKTCCQKIRSQPIGRVIVLLASFSTMVIIGGMVYNVGMLYVVFLDQFKADRATTAWIGSLQFGMLNVAGPVAGVISQKFSCRFSVIIGGLLVSTGLVVSAFATSVYYLIASCGLLVGIGYGLSYSPSVVMVGLLFARRRILATAFAVAGMSIGQLSYPFLIENLVHKFGWRGALLLMGGIALHIVLFGFLMSPTIAYAGRSTTKKGPPPTHKKQMVTDPGILCNPHFDIYVFSLFLFAFGLSIVSVHLPALGNEIHLNADQRARLMSFMGMANLLGRIILGIIGNSGKVGVVLLHCITCGFSGLVMVFYSQCHSFTALVLTSMAYGLFSCGFALFLSLVAIELLGLRNIAFGLGIAMMGVGFGLFTGAPTGGWLFDLSGSYNVPFYVGGAIVICSGLIMLPSWRLYVHPAEHDKITMKDDEEDEEDEGEEEEDEEKNIQSSESPVTEEIPLNPVESENEVIKDDNEKQNEEIQNGELPTNKAAV
ncbi:monocarboxylate transporter 13 isoform X2 [Lingula anatina]|uniref:Monocarboxylate transporter 13 isoform X2 n=1 Tax=Lingula anatina TaxID=7574 RepID=A0A1S3JVH6_LINAN|nr:monocarboxylate transporter 13 isoform X2 [Lingula anatina]|eukprot:XP_013414089.1 monocarboxylate transporter 13 isoform X2 [Lingula anatina]